MRSRGLVRRRLLTFSTIMSLVGETILDSLLCFLNSAKQDFSNDSILHILDAFYSHENIKVAKTTLVNMLYKDLMWSGGVIQKRR